MNTAKATACVVAAGVLWGCISLFVRALGAAGLTSAEIAGVRMAVGAIGMLAVILVVDPGKLRIRLRDLWLFAGMGVVSVTLFNICYFTCITLSEASIAVVLLYTSPIWVMLMSALFFHERITGRKLVALVLTFAGCVLVAGVLGGAVRLTPLALLVGLASGFFYATYSIFGRVAVKRYDTLTITFYTFLTGLLASLVIVDVGHTAAVVASDLGVLLWCLGIGVFCTIAPYLLYTTGLKYLEASRAAILVTVEPLVGSLLGIFAYGESTGPFKLAGMACILAAVVLAGHEGAADDGTRPDGGRRASLDDDGPQPDGAGRASLDDDGPQPDGAVRASASLDVGRLDGACNRPVDGGVASPEETRSRLEGGR